eukprot:g11887.t1
MSQAAYGAYGYSSSQAAQAALNAELFSLKCETGFMVVGLQDGEAVCTPIRVVSTLITMSVASAWFSRRKSIKKLLLFFCHWVAGLLHQLAFMAEATMISVCWTAGNLDGLIKAFKFLELAAGHMLAITNLAICVNLALVIMSHRTLTRVRSVSSPSLMLLFLAISVGAAAASVPFWDYTVISGTGFWVASDNQHSSRWVKVSTFYIELFVGVCMVFIVAWLLLFRMNEIKECWKLHVRIRYYFGLTIVGTAANIGLGICGTIYAIRDEEGELLVVATWAFRYIHVALDTIVLYGVLGARNVDERASASPSSSSTGAAVVVTATAPGFRGPRQPSNTSKRKRGTCAKECPEDLRRQQAHLKFTAAHQARHAAREQSSGVGDGDEERPKDESESASVFNEAFAASTQDITTALAHLVAESKQNPPQTAAGTGTGVFGAANFEGLGSCSGEAAAVDGREDIREKLDALVDRVNGLRKRTAEATLFLTVYDLRRAQEEVDKLWASVESTRAELAPRKKFAFRTRKTKTSSKNRNKSTSKSNTCNWEVVAAGKAEDGGNDKDQETAPSPGVRGDESGGEENPGLHDLREQEVEVVAENADKDKDFNVTDLDKCKVTILHLLGTLRLRRLTSCRVVCGPVQGPIYVEGCKDCVIVAVGRQLRIHDSEGIDFYVLLASGPIIEDCSGLRFAPARLRYPQYQEHLQAAGLDAVTNAWEDVKDFKWHRAQKSPNWDVVPEAERESDSLVLKAPK